MNLQKYLVLLHQGREQITVFPSHVEHRAIADYLRGELGTGLEIVSAGFWCHDPLWVGSNSASLGIDSRKQDKALMAAFLVSADRAAWDLCKMFEEATRHEPQLQGPGRPSLSL